MHLLIFQSVQYLKHGLTNESVIAKTNGFFLDDIPKNMSPAPFTR